MVFLKILTCALSMSFCFMSIYGLTTSAVELALFTEYNPAGDADPLGDLSDPLDWLQLNIAYLVGFWIFFSSVCAVIYRRLSCFDEISKFFIDLFLPTVATIILALILGAVLPVYGWGSAGKCCYRPRAWHIFSRNTFYNHNSPLNKKRAKVVNLALKMPFILLQVFKERLWVKILCKIRG